MQQTPNTTAPGETFELDYELRGTGEPVLFIAGANDSRHAWDLIVPALESSFSCVTFDNRDVGRSPRSGSGYSLMDMAADTIAVLDRAKVDAAHVVGHSLGSAVAQHLCLIAPERARSLTLVGSWARTDEYTRAMVATWIQWTRVLDDDGLAAGCALFWFGESTIARVGMDEIVSQCASLLRDQGRDALRRQLGVIFDHDTSERLGELRMPVQVLWGEEERTFSERHARELVSGIPGATLVRIPGAGHSPTVEAPEAVEAALDAFLRRH